MRDIATAEQTRVAIERDRDIVAARQRARAIVLQMGFSPGAATLVATAISELARNILLYAGCGEIVLQPVENSADRGLAVVARDQGPGIPSVARALEDGYSTSGRLGLGLPGVKRLMDEVQIESRVGGGTTVRAVKWRRGT
jgi:serine/threonine-protein kinase RsbT